MLKTTPQKLFFIFVTLNISIFPASSPEKSSPRPSPAKPFQQATVVGLIVRHGIVPCRGQLGCPQCFYDFDTKLHSPTIAYHGHWSKPTFLCVHPVCLQCFAAFPSCKICLTQRDTALPIMLNDYNETTGFTPLMQAVANGDLIGVRLLILAGADINKKSNYTYSFNADDELAFYMKPCDGDKFSVTISCTALELALAGGHEACAAALREAGAEEPAEP